MLADRIKRIEIADIRQWLDAAENLSELNKGIGRKKPTHWYLDEVVGVPLHLRMVVQELVKERDGDVSQDALDSISFFSLCKGLFLPLSSMQPEKAAHIFGFKVDPPPDSTGREALVGEFLKKDVGLTVLQKLGCLLGDPFQGKPSTFRRDSLLRLLLMQQLVTRRSLLDRLTQVGEVAVLFAESRPNRRSHPPLTAAEVIESLRLLEGQRRRFKFDVLQDLHSRCGKLEAYFLAKLLLRKAGFGFEYEGSLLARQLGEHYGVSPEAVSHAMALTDAFNVARVLEDEGAEGLKRTRLQPLAAVRPALASGSTGKIKNYPVWVERKYDGIRLMLHKSTGQQGAVLCGAYTRNRGDWLELVRGLDMTIKMLPAQSCIVDGELYGTIVDLNGSRPASAYEVYAALQGDSGRPVGLRFAAFDIIYLNGQDLTSLPLSQRRQWLQKVVGPLVQMPTPVPIKVAEGQMAESKNDLNRLYQHFRNQGYEGIIAKDPNGPYRLASRDPSWTKRKPEITLDLVLLGAVFAVTTKERTGAFGSYVIGAKTAEGTFIEVGDVAGVDQARDLQLQSVIMREGLITGRRIERASASGTRPGLELRPHIVVTVRFEGVIKGNNTGQLSLRDPTLVLIRSDKSAIEADKVGALEEIYLRYSVG